MDKGKSLEMTNQIELHYYFTDNSHSLDAFTRNKCEAEFLYIVKEILTILDVDIKIETIASQEGGLKERWEFISKNHAPITAMSAVIAAVTGIVALVLNQLPASETKLDLLNIEKVKLEIKKLKNEEDNKNINVPSIVSYFNSDYKVIKHRSTFFETLMANDKITKIETSQMYNNSFVKTVKTIEKKEFYDYIVAEGKLPLEIIENAQIEIISPVLKQGNYKWKGIYKGNLIEFSMKCQTFKQSVFDKEILFQNGFSIICVLEIKNVIDELGELKVKNYTVSTVTSIIEDNVKIETEQGKKYFAKKKSDLSRPSLFD